VAFGRWSELQAPGRALGRQRQRVAELGEEDIEREHGDNDADCWVEELLQTLNLFILLLLCLLHIEYTRFRVSPVNLLTG